MDTACMPASSSGEVYYQTQADIITRCTAIMIILTKTWGALLWGKPGHKKLLRKHKLLDFL